MKRLALVVLSLLVMLTGCSSGSSGAKPSPVSSTAAVPQVAIVPAKAGCKSYTVHSDPSLDVPGCYGVSSMKPGEQFDATPNFFFFKKCGRPCWLPLYPQPILVPGQAVTKGLPCEYRVLESDTGFCQDSESQTADYVHVVCQVHSTLEAAQPGDSDLVDDAGHHSNIWDQVYVPADAVVGDTSILERAPDGQGYLAYGSDLWLQNTGWHGIPC